MRRRLARPFGQSVSPTRVVSLLFALALLWVLIDRARDPQMWRWLAVDDEIASEAPLPAGATPALPESLRPGPNDRDADEREATERLLELVTDRTPLRSPEMAAYWRLIDWIRTEPFHELERRAQSGVPFVQIWEQPDRYRGELLRLRLHVRRILEFEAPADSGVDLPKVYEIWGWTDDSMSLPYVVAVPELPPGLRTGADVRGEIVFVGYFLKVMSYTAADATRGAPLLVGRIRLAEPSVPKAASWDDGTMIFFAGMAGLAAVGLWYWFTQQKRSSKHKLRSAPATDFGNGFQAPAGGTGQPDEDLFDIFSAGPRTEDRD